MKKILLIFLVLILSVLVLSCGDESYVSTADTSGSTVSTTNTTKSTNKPNSATTSTSATTEPEVSRPYIYPEAPKGLTEKVRYDCGEDGLYIIKGYGYFEENGNCIEEHYYVLDRELDILDCRIIAYNTLDKDGNIILSEGHYISNPYYAARETVLNIIALNDSEYDYKTVDEDDNITLYIKEIKNAEGKVIKEEYYNKNGRFVRAEEAEYYENGNIKLYRSRDAKNNITYECEYNEQGNFVSYTQYDEVQRVCAKRSAEYYESGKIKKYTSVSVDKSGYEGIADVTEFDEDGKITARPSLSYFYTPDGTLTQIWNQNVDVYSFDKYGYLVSYEGRVNGQLGTKVYITYNYNSNGVLTSVVTKNSQNSATTTVRYIYNSDGSGKITYTNQYGIQNQVIITDINGRIIQTETHNNVERTSYQTFTYDRYGKLVKAQDYTNETLDYEYIYEYNEHDDLVKYTKITYFSSYDTTEYTVYEYYDNGYLKLETSYDRWGLSRKVEYYEDGGYTYTDYSLGEFNNENTYDRYGNQIRTVYPWGNSWEIAEYEYYENGEKKKFMLYLDDVFQRGEEYAENGNVTKRYELNDAGKIVGTEYIKNNEGRTIRENIYEDDILIGYITYEYFDSEFGYTSVYKIKAEYDANGNILNYFENSAILYPWSGTYAYDHLPTKEEHYENGEIISYIYKSYTVVEDSVYVSVTEELKDGVVYKNKYEYKKNNDTSFVNYSKADLIYSEYYEDEKLISYSTYVYSQYCSKARRITTYNTKGEVIELRENDTNGSLNVMYRYEYYENGALKNKTEWCQDFDHSEIMLAKTEYGENGDILSEEKYDYKAQVTYSCKYVYGDEGKLEYKDILQNDKHEYVYFRYDENGVLVKTESYENEVLKEYTNFTYYENGILKEEVQYNVTLDRTESVMIYDEKGNLTNKYGRPSKQSPDSELIWGDDYTYIYDENNRITEMRYKSINSISVWVEKYEYHSNGVVSVLKTYWDDRVNDTEYFDENGYKLYK